LTAPAPVSYSFFGTDAASNGKLVVVGSQTEDVSGQYDSARRSSTARASGASWTYDDQLAASDVASYDHFGVQVALTSDAILVTADGNDTPGGSDFGVLYGFDRDEITLAITPSAPAPGQTMTFSAFRGEEGGLCMITIEDAGGVPLLPPAARLRLRRRPHADVHGRRAEPAVRR
jgi:hypothetical protein